MNNVDIHADDYALTIQTSNDILDCMRAGKLNSISIIPNMSCFDECMELLYKEIPNLPFLPFMSVHINLVEGKSLNEKSVAAAFNPNGIIISSWGKLYLWSFIIGKKNPLRLAIEEEIAAQIAICQKAIEKCISIANESGIPCSQNGLRIDSHQHTHMIPLVWNGCIKAIQSGSYSVEYIRNSYEPLLVFLKNSRTRSSYRPVNIVKNRILALHSKKVGRFSDRNNLKKMRLWGLIMSGRMDYERISLLMDGVLSVCEKEGRSLEILFHPGTLLESEITPELNKDAVDDFYLSDGRAVEKEAVMRL